MLTDAQKDRVFDYLDRAWECEVSSERTKWAGKVLGIDPDQLDAYLLLSQAEITIAERFALLNEAVRRGKIIWADEIKRPAQSYFWLDINTRPFMRCLHVLALAQWEADDRATAIKNARLLLRLNANDNQGIRSLLLAWYPETGDWDAFEKLLKKFSDDCSADYLYSACLNAFRTGSKADELVAEALTANPFVPAFLANKNMVPPFDGDSLLAGYVTMGSESEAHAYAELNRSAWLSVPGGINWLLKYVTTK